MAMQLRVEDKLQGAQNFPTWKEMITRILDVSDAEEHIDSTKVAPTDTIDLAAWKKIDSKAMLIIMCNTLILTPLAFTIYDTYIVNDLGTELKAKAPP